MDQTVIAASNASSQPAILVILEPISPKNTGDMPSSPMETDSPSNKPFLPNVAGSLKTNKLPPAYKSTSFCKLQPSRGSIIKRVFKSFFDDLRELFQIRESGCESCIKSQKVPSSAEVAFPSPCCCIM